MNNFVSATKANDVDDDDVRAHMHYSLKCNDDKAVGLPAKR